MRRINTILKLFLFFLIIVSTGLYAQVRIGFQYGMQPVDVVNDTDGNYYLLTKYNVQIFNAQGEFLRKFTVPKLGQYEVELAGIEVDDDKNIFVIDAQNAKVFAFGNNGVLKYSFGEFGTAIGKLYLPSDIALGEDGNIYLANAGRKAVSVFTKAGVFIKEIGSEGTGDGQFFSIDRLAVSASGNVYGVDWYSRKIQVFDSQGNFLLSFGSQGTAQGQFKNFPKGITVDSNSGRIFVCEPNSNRVNVFDMTGNYLSEFSSSAQNIDFSGSNLVVAEAPDRIRNIALDGTEISIIGGKSSLPGNVNGIKGLSFDTDGNLYVADGGNYRIQVFNTNGQFLRAFGSQGSNDNEFFNLGGLTIDKNNNLYVIDQNVIKIFTKEGTFVRKFGSAGSTNGSFYSPSDIIVDDEGKIYVADTYNKRMQVFSNDGTFIRTQSYVSENAFSVGLDKQGNSYLGAGTGWVTAFNSLGSVLSLLKNNGLSNSVMYVPSSIVAKEDIIYIRDSRYFHKYNRNTRMWISRHGIQGDNPGEFTSGLEPSNHRMVLNRTETMFAVSDGLCVQLFPLNNTISLLPIPAKYVGDAEFELPLNSSAGLPISYSTNDPTVASVTGNKVTIKKAGTVSVIANQAGNVLTPAAQQVAQDLVILKKDQTINFQLSTSVELKELSLFLTAEASSGLPVAFSVDDASIARIEDGKLILLKEGVVKVTASQPGDENYSAAMVVREISIIKSDQAITFQIVPLVEMKEISLPLTGESSAGLDITYTVDDPAIARIENGKLILLRDGIIKITASQTGNEYYNAAIDVVREVSIIRSEQTITFNTLPDKTYGDASFNVEVTASSGQLVTLSSSDTEVATISGNTITIVGAGMATITASQTGNRYYAQAPAIEQNLFVSKALQEITFSDISDQRMEDGTFQLNATSTFGLPVTYIGSHPEVATISGDIVTFHKPGTIAIAANQAGNENYEAAIQVAKTLTILKKEQTITFGSLSDRIVGEAPFALSATSTSNLSITFTSSNNDVASIEDNIVTLHGDGTVTITARQDGNEMFGSAMAEQSMVVRLVTEAEDPINQVVSVYPNPAADKIIIVSTAGGEVELVTMHDTTGRSIMLNLTKRDMSVYEADISSLPQGLYTIRIQTRKTLQSVKFIKK